jgi:hypothetical protein
MNKPRFKWYWVSPKNLGISWFLKISFNRYLPWIRFFGITLIKIL